MSEENQKITKEELEYIELKKAGFTRVEIKEMDRRASENSIYREEFMSELFSQYEILKEFVYKN